jgi:hypothetical protein
MKTRQTWPALREQVERPDEVVLPLTLADRAEQRHGDLVLVDAERGTGR